MIKNLYYLLMHWLMDTLPKPDDHHIKCAKCGWEVSGVSQVPLTKISTHVLKGSCCICGSDRLYYKKDWLDLKASPVDLEFKLYTKGE